MKDLSIILPMNYLFFLVQTLNTWMLFRIINIWTIWFNIWINITLISYTSNTLLLVITLMQSSNLTSHGLLSMMICFHMQIIQHNTGLDFLHLEQMIKDTQELHLLSCMHLSYYILKKCLINLHLNLKLSIFNNLLLLCKTLLESTNIMMLLPALLINM